MPRINGRVQADAIRRYDRPIQYTEPTGTLPIGVIVPFDFELDWEYWKYLPRHVTLYFTRTPIVRRPVGLDLARAVSRPSTVWQATQALLSVDPQVVLYACSSGSFVHGREGERAIRETMLEAGAQRAVTTSSAMVDALQAAEARRITVVTSYTEPLTRCLIDFAEAEGFEVVSARYLDIDRDISAVDPSTIRQLVLDAYHPDAEAVFIGCTAVRTYVIVADLEREIGVPVFTSNQVSLWAALCAAGAMYRDVEEMDERVVRRSVPDGTLDGNPPRESPRDSAIVRGTDARERDKPRPERCDRHLTRPITLHTASPMRTLLGRAEIGG